MRKDFASLRQCCPGLAARDLPNPRFIWISNLLSLPQEAERSAFTLVLGYLGSTSCSSAETLLTKSRPV